MEFLVNLYQEKILWKSFYYENAFDSLLIRSSLFRIADKSHRSGYVFNSITLVAVMAGIATDENFHKDFYLKRIVRLI